MSQATVLKDLNVTIVGPTLEGLTEVLREEGAIEVPPGESTAGIITTYGAEPHELQRCLELSPHSSWIQLPTAGIEVFRDVIQSEAGRDRLWTSAKGAYAKPVAEHALLLVLALLRDLGSRVVARTWGTPSGRSLHGLRAVVVGAGGVAIEIIRLLKMFDTHVTAVRRRLEPVEGADQTCLSSELNDHLPETDVLILAAALTPETRNLIDAQALKVMDPQSIVVNIGRGALIDTEALIAALAERRIYAAGLDVTDPEPLPDGHPLWEEAQCLITPHTADTMEMIIPLYRDRIRRNIQALRTQTPFEGVVDVSAGY